MREKVVKFTEVEQKLAEVVIADELVLGIGSDVSLN